MAGDDQRGVCAGNRDLNRCRIKCVSHIGNAHCSRTTNITAHEIANAANQMYTLVEQIQNVISKFKINSDKVKILVQN